MLKELAGFTSLANDWDGYGASAPSPEMLSYAEAVTYAIDRAGIDVLSVSPGPADEIQLNFMVAERYIDLVIDAVGWRWLTYHDGKRVSSGSLRLSRSIEDTLEGMLAGIPA